MGGCVSSSLLNQDDELSQHIVSLTSTTYGLLTSLDPPSSSTPTTTIMVPPTPPQTRFTLGSLFTNTPLSDPISFVRPEEKDEEPQEVINSWELMDGLDSTAESFRFSSPLHKLLFLDHNSIPSIFYHNHNSTLSHPPLYCSKSYNQLQEASFRTYSQEKAVAISNSLHSINYSLERFEKLCPPKGEDKVVIYTTTLRGVRKTFEECNAVRTAIQGLGIAVCERDISMDRSFREELRELMKGKDSTHLVPPRVFVRGRYLGGAEEVMRIVEDGCLGELLEGLPKVRAGHVCEGCGDVRFLPCFSCNGSCKMVMVVKEDQNDRSVGRAVMVRCPDCNENGLVLCPICS